MNGPDQLHILAGWVVDGSGGAIRQRVLVSIDDSVITAVVPEVGADVPPIGLLDLTHCTIIPALVDSHVHLCMSGSGDGTVRQDQLRLSLEEAREVIVTHLVEHLAHGIMAVRDGGDCGAHSLRVIRRLLPNPRIPVVVRCAGRGWHAQGRYGRFIGRSPGPGETLADAVHCCHDPMDHLKVINSGVNSLLELGRPTPAQFAPGDLRAAVAVAERRGRPTMVHANGVEPVREALEAGCHSLEHGYFMGRDNLERLARQQITWVPTVAPMSALARHPGLPPEQTAIARRTVAHQLDQLRTARALGVLVALGTDSGSLGVDHGRAVAEELRLLVDSGYPLAAAIQCATAHGARLLGLDHQLGRIAPGMSASFVAVEGPPSELLERMICPHSVWACGRMLLFSRSSAAES